jgi:nucleoside 2-deoxyribosyltransferase|tara:strand:+ start:4125 stop:4538 length:414 start_codon:yes stop_codon:yes gene_type:complete
MKIYIAYKLSGVDREQLQKRLESISKTIEETGNKSFIFMRDIQDWQPGDIGPKEIMDKAMKEMRNCDAILSIIETQEKGEGLLLESGFMKALGKKVIIATGPNGRGFLLKAIADELIEFENEGDLKEKLKKAFGTLV